MKSVIVLITILFFCTFLNAQAPAQFNYQAVARDAAGTVITGALQVKISILEDAEDGINRYTETHQVITSTQGIFNLKIGKGGIISGDFSAVDWATHQYWVKVELKAPEASGFIEMGRTQILSVPYALYAANAGDELTSGAGINIANHVIQNTGDLSNSNEIQSLTVNGNQLSISNGNTVTIPTGTTYTEGAGIDINGNIISSNDASATNEIQSLVVNGNQLSISNGNTVTMPTGTTYTEGAGIDINGNVISANDVSPTNEMQSLSVNGNQLSISGGNNVTLPTVTTYTEGAGIDINGNIITATDPSTTNEIQTLSLNGQQLSLSNGGGTVSLPAGGGNGWSVNANLTSSSPNTNNVTIGAANTDARLNVASTGAAHAGSFYSPGAGDAVHAYCNGTGAAISAVSANGLAGYFSSSDQLALRVAQGDVKIGEGASQFGFALEVEGSGFFSGLGSGAALRAHQHGQAYGLDVQNFEGGVAGHFQVLPGASGRTLQLTSSVGVEHGMEIHTPAGDWQTYVDNAKDLNLAFNTTLKAWIYDTDGSYHNSSDSRLKKDIKPFSHVLAGLSKLQAYTYHMRDAADDSPISVGFMAQEVEAQFPELVIEKDGYKSLCYDHFAVLGIQAINEQQTEIEAQAKEIAELKAMVSQLKTQMDQGSKGGRTKR